MSLFVKICGLKTRADVESAVTAGADAIGFVFAESKRRVTPAEAKAAAADAPVTKVAVMLHPTNDEWLAVLEGFEPDVLQTDAEDFASLAVPDYVARWPVLREGGEMPGDWPETFVFEGAKSGHGEIVDWAKAREHAMRGQLILAGGLDSENVATAVALAQPWGVDVSSGVESAPGTKDPQLIHSFLKAARAAEHRL